MTNRCSRQHHQDDDQRHEAEGQVPVHAAVRHTTGDGTPALKSSVRRAVDAPLERVVERGMDHRSFGVVARLGDVTHIDVVRGVQHVFEHPRERFPEGGGGVLHAGRLELSTTAPCLGETDRAALDQTASEGDQSSADHESERQQRRREHAADARKTYLPPVVQRFREVEARDVAGRVDHSGDDQKRSHPEDQAERGKHAGPGPHGRTDLRGPFGPLRAGKSKEADADRLGEGERGQTTGECEHADADRHRHGDGHVAGGKAMEHALEEEPFAHETAEGGKGGNGQSTHQKNGAAHRHPFAGGRRARRGPYPRWLVGRSSQRERANP